MAKQVKKLDVSFLPIEIQNALARANDDSSDDDDAPPPPPASASVVSSTNSSSSLSASSSSKVGGLLAMLPKPKAEFAIVAPPPLPAPTARAVAPSSSSSSSSSAPCMNLVGYDDDDDNDEHEDEDDDKGREQQSQQQQQNPQGGSSASLFTFASKATLQPLPAPAAWVPLPPTAFHHAQGLHRGGGEEVGAEEADEGEFEEEEEEEQPAPQYQYEYEEDGREMSSRKRLRALEQQLLHGAAGPSSTTALDALGIPLQTIDPSQRHWDQASYLQNQHETSAILQSFKITAASAGPTRTQKQKGQLSAMLAGAARAELDMMQTKGARVASRKETKAKYGW